MLTIVMYHCVRDVQPGLCGLKGLTLQGFRGQLEYLQRRHSVVTMEEVMYAVQGSPADLPADAALLTFDGGWLDHYTTVLPLLDERGWQGSFFVPAKPVLERKALDVHKLQLALEGCTKSHAVFEELLDLLDEYREQYDLPSTEAYWKRLARAGRCESPETVFMKQLLLCELPSPVRENVCERLFAGRLSNCDAVPIESLYMSLDQLRLMQRLGMHIGVHGDTHCRLDRLGAEALQQEIRASLELLSQVGADTDSWSIAYPFGAHDEQLRAQLRSAGARIGLTREAARADLWRHNPLMLPRLDAEDVPKQFSTARVPVMVGTPAS
jgi:peptidoglycan/xylan/chitin deacetylase (PgdA/CDA1 family)